MLAIFQLVGRDMWGTMTFVSKWNHAYTYQVPALVPSTLRYYDLVIPALPRVGQAPLFDLACFFVTWSHNWAFAVTRLGYYSAPTDVCAHSIMPFVPHVLELLVVKLSVCPMMLFRGLHLRLIGASMLSCGYGGSRGLDRSRGISKASDYSLLSSYG